MESGSSSDRAGPAGERTSDHPSSSSGFTTGSHLDQRHNGGRKGSTSSSSNSSSDSLFASQSTNSTTMSASGSGHGDASYSSASSASSTRDNVEDDDVPAWTRAAERRDKQDLEKVKRLKNSLNFRADRYNDPITTARGTSTRGPQAWKWFEPAIAPSPAALYLWRQDHCRQHQLRIGSPADRLFYEHFVTTNYHPHIVGHILSGQQNHERYLTLCDYRCRNGDSSFLTEEDAARVTVERIMYNVVEAICTVSIPFNREVDTREMHNRKAVPVPMFRERNKYQDEWHQWCRASGSNVSNVLLDYAVYASHHPYSIYHKSKYGDFGSPHPYIPYSITASNEFEKSLGEQVRQEQEALEWIAARRAKCKTQAELEEMGLQMREKETKGRATDGSTAVNGSHPTADTAGAMGNAAAAQAVVEATHSVNSSSTSASPPSDIVPVSLPDEVVIDHEAEQPEAMMGEPSADKTRPLDSQQQSAPVPVAAPTQQQAKVAAATSHSHPITVSVIVPDSLTDWIRRTAWEQLQDQPQELLDYLCDEKRRDLPWPQQGAANSSRFSSWSKGFVRLPSLLNLAAVVTEDEMPWRIAHRENGAATPAAPSDVPEYESGLSQSPAGPRWAAAKSPQREPPATFKVGNLYLSSCPGKKVRLTGAVRGRGAVCRDLGIDLKRFKELGVGTLVCCLSDAELETIGVKWEEYLHEADRLGLDLIRIPIVEGNCPTSQAGLDPWLNEIVLHCTLKGINVLVHCRGGVGRAGTLAACWLIKMGLVDEHRPEETPASAGWPDLPLGARGVSQSSPGQEIMWQSLQVVRLRRSTKAIETAEQAAYVAKFGDYIVQRWKEEGGEKRGAEPYRWDHLQRYLALSQAFWQRLRGDAQKWVQSEKAARLLREEEQRKAAQEQASHSPNTTKALHGSTGKVLSPKQPPVTNGDHAKAAPHSALSWASNINSRHAAQIPTNSGSNATAASSLSSGNAPTVSPGAADAPTPANGSDDPVLLQRLDANGEPKRKRRNTNTLSVGDMRLDDVEGRGDGPATTNLDDEMEMDSLPVTGR